ncbi:hypothetical protein [uncultured Gilvimarinus sp.]|uniref:hypothetical protein n=1 Tax=uncultured Gilvimarinus sp. TaxID=1689143 RepID=UPI0030ED7A10|tara:strand:- start:4696 stop:5742 length:1047 start_codon:yes stop_codon:yes gene_type:complete
MILSKYAIEAMGYEEFPETDLIEVHFGILKAYSIRGMVFEQSCEEKISGVVSLSERCTIAIAQSINEASKLLTEDIFADDEEEWISDKKANPPFLLIYFKERVPRGLRGGYRREKDGYIYTYDAFPESKTEIREWESDVLPGIVTALTVKLSTLERQIKFIPLERSIFGKTNDGITLFDLKVTGSSSAYISCPKSIDKINSSLESARSLLPVLTKDVCRNFYEALNEPDRMKQFLGYFQFIERYTHSTYKSLNYNDNAKATFNVPGRINESATKFFERIFTDSKNLSQRFHWCAIIVWKNIEENDVNYFLELKKVRDRLSHGEHVEESELPVGRAKKLALKLLGADQT